MRKKRKFTKRMGVLSFVIGAAAVTGLVLSIKNITK